MSAKSWGLPFVCVICGYRTAEKLVIKDHVYEKHFKGEDCNHVQSCAFSSAVAQAGASACMDRRAVYAVRQEIMNCQNVVVGYSSKPDPTELMSQSAIQYQYPESSDLHDSSAQYCLHGC